MPAVSTEARLAGACESAPKVTKNAVAKSYTMYEWPDGTTRSKPVPLAPYELGEWVNITPSDVTPGDNDTLLGQGIAYDPLNPGTIFWCNGPFDNESGDEGVWRSTDWGDTWTRVGAVTPLEIGYSDHIDNPVAVRVAGSRIWVGAGVRGTAQGLFYSDDGGDTWTRPSTFESTLEGAGVANWMDLYSIAVDPTDNDHILVTFHSGWGGGYGDDSGVAETEDGGSTWTVHDPETTWATGHAINFLYDPDNAQGNSNTWLLGTQSDGMWRTTNGGTSWTQETTENIAHGGQQIYYTDEGVLYASGETSVLRSDDNGATWETALAIPTWSVTGDGTNIYAKHNGATEPLQYSAETDGDTWDDLDATSFNGGNFQSQYDPTTGVLFSSFWNDGVWAKKLREP
jgi:hypothetical protein